jgi:hypothetical protein
MTRVTTPEQARQLGFVSSPTIRIMGRDAALEVKEDACSGCSSLCGSDIACRVWTLRGTECSVPPKAMIVDAILREADLHGSDAKAIHPPVEQFPENLTRFFEGVGDQKTRKRQVG